MEGAWLSTTGKKKGKKKHRTSIHAHAARENEANWKEMQKKWGISDDQKKKERGLKAPAYSSKPEPYRRDTGPRHASKPDTVGVALRAPDKVYTGDAMIGIGQLHKSNAIPVFKAEDALDLAKMRRG